MNDKQRSVGAMLAMAGASAYVGWQALQRLRRVDFTGQIVLITGGSRGLGLLLAREFGRHGCQLAVCARDEAELESAREDLAERGIDAMTVPCDVRDPNQVEEMVGRVEARYGHIDVLVNNAGIIQAGPVDAMTLEDFRDAMASNFWGGVHATLAVLPEMRRRQAGRIVNITSIGGKLAVPHLLPYDCAKFAAVGFSEGLRAELAQHGITVTTIVPGLMRTGSAVQALFKGQRDLEWTWFSLGSATPITAMSAQRAAERIVKAAARGEAEVTLSWQAKLLRLTHDLFPGATSNLFAAVNHVLPDAGIDESEPSLGMDLSTTASPSAATASVHRAARETHEFAGERRPSAEHARRAGQDDGPEPMEGDRG